MAHEEGCNIYPHEEHYKVNVTRAALGAGRAARAQRTARAAERRRRRSKQQERRRTQGARSPPTARCGGGAVDADVAAQLEGDGRADVSHDLAVVGGRQWHGHVEGHWRGERGRGGSSEHNMRRVAQQGVGLPSGQRGEGVEGRAGGT